jgi:outer membrane protein OmpA-like peptidoglycan-associated protein
MDLPKKRSYRYVTGVYAVFIILFAFTVSLFYTSRCQKSPSLAKQDDFILKSEGSTEDIQKTAEPIDINHGKSENKFEAYKSDDLTDNENLSTPQDKTDSSDGEKLNIENFKTPSGKAFKQNDNPTPAKPALISSRQKGVIYFSADSTGLTNNALEKLMAITGYLLKYPDAEVIIEGYGDSNKNYRHNKRLSQLRANIVKNYLVRKGIASARIKAFWMGSENPSGGDDSQEDRNKTHQVEIQFKMGSKGDLKN